MCAPDKVWTANICSRGFGLHYFYGVDLGCACGPGMAGCRVSSPLEHSCAVNVNATQKEHRAVTAQVILIFEPAFCSIGSDGNVSVYNVGDGGSIPGSERSPGEGATVHGVAKSRARLSDFTVIFCSINCLSTNH